MLWFRCAVDKSAYLTYSIRQASYFFPGPWECWKIIYKCSIVQADFIENYFEITSWFEVRVFLEGNKACHKRPFASWKKTFFWNKLFLCPLCLPSDLYAFCLESSAGYKQSKYAHPLITISFPTPEWFSNFIISILINGRKNYN